MDGLRRLVVSQVLKPGDKLPSVRELASQLAINPNTIQRAYRELEAQGYIYSIPGKGSFAAERAEVDQARVEKLLRRFDETVTELRFLGYSGEKLCQRIREGGEDA